MYSILFIILSKIEFQLKNTKFQFFFVGKSWIFMEFEEYSFKYPLNKNGYKKKWIKLLIYCTFVLEV